MKSIFHHFQRDFIRANKTIFLKGDSPNLNIEIKLRKPSKNDVAKIEYLSLISVFHRKWFP